MNKSQWRCMNPQRNNMNNQPIFEMITGSVDNNVTAPPRQPFVVSNGEWYYEVIEEVIDGKQTDRGEN